MKNINIPLCVISIVSFFTLSCEKEITNFEESKLQVLTVPKSSNSQSSKILHFSSWANYDETLESLLNDVDTWEEYFVNLHPDASVGELDSIEEITGHDENAPLFEFINTYGHSNSLSNYLSLEEDWLNNEVLDTNFDPSDEFWGLIEEELSLVNNDGAIAVNETIYVFRLDSLYAFPDMDWNNYLDFINSTNQPSEILLKTSGKSCKAWKSNKAFKNYSSNRKYLRKIRFHNYPHKGVSKSRIKSYKKRGGRWKLARAKIGVSSQNHFQNKNCTWTVVQFVDTWRTKNRRKRLNNFASHYAPIIMRVEKGHVIGDYKFNNTVSHLSLTW